ncbi:MAG TPA: hypothetical protein DCP28_30980 [Cytophagales bacterium]|nr:hypothetical protein [Cytophagales bacterium]
MATITIPATAEEITQLRGLMRAIPAQVPTEALNALIPDSINLGAYQADWNRLIAAINEFNQRVGDPLYREEIRFLEDKVASLQQLKQILSRQKAINDRQLARSREKHDLNRQLYETGGLTRFEYFDSEGLLDAAETSAEGLQKEIVNNDLTINDLQNQRVTKEIEHAEALKKAWRSVQESIRTLNGVLEQWDDTFTLSSPLSGTVSFLRPLAPQDYVKSGEDLLYIIPEAEQTLARGTIPAQRSGLVEVGQRVRIKLIGYPHEQYGYILGVVERIAPIPQEEEYLVQIALPNGLMTHLGTTVEYRPNMPGTLEIVTKDMSLAERFLQAATKQLDR